MRGKIWNFTKPADPKKVMRFENKGEAFSAKHQAGLWLHEHGYRHGSSDWSRYIPAMKGERYDLPQKLYNFDREDYDRVSAVMYSLDYRDGWVEVWLIDRMYILDLVLAYKWYDMIESDWKREEYRDITPYWRKRIQGGRHYTHIRFHRGYTARTMIYRFDGLRIGRGNAQWGAPADRDVFIISLGERYK